MRVPLNEICLDYRDDIIWMAWVLKKEQWNIYDQWYKKCKLPILHRNKLRYTWGAFNQHHVTYGAPPKSQIPLYDDFDELHPAGRPELMACALAREDPNIRGLILDRILPDEHKFLIESGEPWSSLPDHIKEIIGLRKWVLNELYGTKFANCQSLPELMISGLRQRASRRMRRYGFLKALRGKLVLDIGCHTGAMTRICANVADHCIGIDSSEIYVQIAQRMQEFHGHQNTEFLHLSYEDLLQEQLDGFDVILALDVEGLIDMSMIEFFESLYDILVPGGFVIFESNKNPNKKIIHGVLDRVKFRVWPGGSESKRLVLKCKC